MRWIHCLAVFSLLSFTACHPHRNNAADSGVDPATQRPAPVAVTVPVGEDSRWTLSGVLYRAPPADMRESSNRAVLLVHQLGSTKEEWAPLVERMRVRHGITVLTIDLRGHGESAHDANGQPVTWESFGNSQEQWAGLVRDVTAAVLYLRGTVLATSVVVVGSSIGGSAALIAANTNPNINENVAGVVMLSPGLAYHGLDIRDAMARNTAASRPLLMLAGELDAPSAEAVRALSPTLTANTEREVFAGAREHGVSLANSAPARWARIDAWIRRVLDTPLLPPPAPAPPRPARQ